MQFVRILFLDQSGKPGGAELCLLDIAKSMPDRCLVGLLADGPFRQMLEQQQIPVQVLTDEAIRVQKDSSLSQSLGSIQSLITPILKIVRLSRGFDCIYANTQKALVVGAIASLLSQRPLVYHLHDIVSSEHFSRTNRQIIITLANQFASLVIANSEATKVAFRQAGGRSPVEVVYNGFDPATYQISPEQRQQLRQQLGVDAKFVVGHFSRLSPWKGQHVMLEALHHCPSEVTVLLVGDALFGEQAYVNQLHQQVEQLGLQQRVQFLGFRSDVPALMAACDLVAHTSTAPEPFGRVIVEAMLAGTPVVAAAAGGAIELVEPGKTGWLTPPGEALKLADTISDAYHHPQQAKEIARQGQESASQRFRQTRVDQQIQHHLQPFSRTN